MNFLRFGIRDLLWAMVVIGLILGWSLQEAKHRGEKEQLSQKLRKDNGMLGWKLNVARAALLNKEEEISQLQDAHQADLRMLLDQYRDLLPVKKGRPHPEQVCR